MKKMLFLDQYGGLGGGQQILLEAVYSARDAGWEPVVALPEGECARQLQSQGISVAYIKEMNVADGKKSLVDVCMFLIYNLKVFVTLWRFFRGCSCVYVNGSRLLLAAMLAGFFLGKKYVMHIHLNHESAALRLLAFASRQQQSIAVIFPSSFVFVETTKRVPQFARSKCLIIENGLDGRFSSVSFVDRFSNKVLTDVCILGRVCHEKGQDVLISLADNFPDIQFHVIGDSAFSSVEYLNDLKSRKRKNILFHGWVDNVQAKINELGIQVCLVPSRCPRVDANRSFEAAPLVPLQMAALSCLVVVRRLGALQEVADAIGALSFDNDEDLVGIIRSLNNANNTEIVEVCYASYVAVSEKYGNALFRKKLMSFFQSSIFSYERCENL